MAKKKKAKKKAVKRHIKRPARRKSAKKASHKRHAKRSSKKKVSTAGAVSVPKLELEKFEPNIQEQKGLEDLVKGSTTYAWIGAGQCGGRLVKAFYDLGYRKVLAVNTSHHDLELLEIPKEQKFLMDIGEHGAGKDMEKGKEAGLKYQQKILHYLGQMFGTQVKHIMICVGAGGGTGGGCAIELINAAKKYMRSIGIENPDKHVGVFMTLPTIGESNSPVVGKNANKVATELSKLSSAGKISPLIVIDNERINKLYPGLTVKAFWPTINNTVAGLFDIFNRLSSLNSKYTSFDSRDYQTIVQAGGCAIMGLTKVDDYKDKFTLSEAVKNNLEKTLLAEGFDLTTAKVAGCIAVGARSQMADCKGLQDNINYAFDVLSELTGKATIHRGIYEDDKDTLRVYTIIGGLAAPMKRFRGLTE